MANVENLDFKLILDDKEFNKTIANAEKAAQNLNTTLSSILDIKSKIESVSSKDVQSNKNKQKILLENDRTQRSIALNAEREAAARRKIAANEASDIRSHAAINREREALAAARVQLVQEKINKLLKEEKNGLFQSANLWRQVASLAAGYFSVQGATNLVKNLVRVSAEFELQKTTLAAILQDTEAAVKIYEQMKQLAVMSPFSFRELATYAKQLSAYSIPVNELYETTKMLADVSAGLGVDMSRIVLAYGQIRSASFLRGTEVRQLTEAGIPILEELRKQFVALGEEGITVGDVFDKISNRLVPFAMVEKVFKNMTSEGGKFYQMQEIQAETLKGKISNLKDAYEIMFSEIGSNKSGLLNGSVDMIRSLAENYQKVGRVIVGLIASYGAYNVAKRVSLALDTANRASTIANISASKAFTAALWRQTLAYKAYNAVVNGIKKMGWIGLAATAISGIAAAFLSAANQARKFRNELDEISREKYQSARTMSEDLDRLVNITKDATKGSQKYRDAIDEINRKYGEYLPNMLTEKNSYEEIAAAANKATSAIYAKMRASAEDEGRQKIENKYAKDLPKEAEKFKRNLISTGLGEDAAEIIVQGFRDAITRGDEGSFSQILIAEMKSALGDENFNRLWNQITDYSSLTSAAKEYGKSIDNLTKGYDRLAKSIELAFGARGYSSEEQRKAIQPIEYEYAKKAEKIRSEEISQLEAEKKLNQNKIEMLTAIMNKYDEMRDAEIRAGKDGERWGKLIKETWKEIQSLMPAEEGVWQKAVSGLITNPAGNVFKMQTDQTLPEYIDELKKQYKDANEKFNQFNATYTGLLEKRKKGVEISDAELKKAKEQKELYQQRLEIAKKIAYYLSVDLTDKKSTTKSHSGKSEEQKALETRRDSLLKLYDAYKMLADAGIDGQRAKDILSGFFPDHTDVISAGTYLEELRSIAETLRTTYKDADTAANLEDRLGVGGIKQIVEYEKAKADAKKSVEDFKKSLADWIGEGELYGQGSVFDASKIVADYEKALKNLSDKKGQMIDNLNKAYNESLVSPETMMSAEDFVKALDEIDNEIARLSGNELSKAKDKIDALAETVVKDVAKMKGIDLEDWSQKTGNELRRVAKELTDAFYTNGKLDINKLPEDLRKALDEIPDGLNVFKRSLDTFLGGKDGGLFGKLFKDLKKNDVQIMKYAASSLLELSDAVLEFADSAGNAKLSKAITGIKQIADTAKSIAEGFLVGGVIGAAIGGFTSLIKGALQFATETANARKEYLKLVSELEYSQSERSLTSGVNSIFGKNIITSMTNAATKISELTKKNEEYKQSLKDISATKVDSKFLFFANETTASLEFFMNQYGELLDEQGIISEEVLTKIAEELNIADINIVNEIINNSKLLKAAMEQFESDLSELWSQLSDDISSEMIQAFDETGNAISKLEDSFSNLGRTILEALTQSAVLEVLDKYKEEVAQIAKNYVGSSKDQAAIEDMTSALKGVVDRVTEDAKGIADYVNTLGNALSEAGLYQREIGGTSISQGIAGITEETATLLASYINAIRADVSAQRFTLDAIGSDLKLILSKMGASPTLAEYLTKIEANTYDTAQYSSRILSRLESVIGDGATAYINIA